MKTKSPTSLLSVRDLEVTVADKNILHGVNMMASSGDLLAIMGPTGSGKTTLLNTISGRVLYTSGEITLNGHSLNKQIRRRLGYVLQDDIFMSRLTLYETLYLYHGVQFLLEEEAGVPGENLRYAVGKLAILVKTYFTAMIRISEKVPWEEKKDRIRNIVDALDMQKCLHTVIGDVFSRGLSGGEKKRANIACELLVDPDIMLIDEPTSGLDSSTAHSLMTQLRNYATNYNKTIIATIHQPSSQVYHLFSTLLLMMDGHVAYFGKATDALDFFEKIGLQCAVHFNPADFLLALMKSDEETKTKILEEAKRNGKFQNVIELSALENGKRIQTSHASIDTTDSTVAIVGFHKNGSANSFIDVCTVDVEKMDNLLNVRHEWPTSFWTQYRMLTWRQFRQSRGHILNKFDVFEAIFIALIAGAVYFQMDQTYRNLRDKMGTVFFSTSFWGFQCMILTVTSFPAERGVIQKERSSGAYRLSAYYVSKITSELPLILLVPVMFYSIIYWMAALGDGILFCIFVGINLLYCLVIQSIGHLLGAALPDIKLCLTVGTTYLLFSLLLSGFFNAHLPFWLQWAKYLSMIHYPFASLTILTTRDMPALWCNTTSVELFPGCGGNVTFLTNKEVLKDFGIDNPFFCYIATIGILLIILRILGYYVLRWKH